MDDFFLADSYSPQRPPRGAAGRGNHTASINQLLRMPSKDTLYYQEKALNFSCHSWRNSISGSNKQPAKGGHWLGVGVLPARREHEHWHPAIFLPTSPASQTGRDMRTGIQAQTIW